MSSLNINKVIARIIVPTLREIGFTKFQKRTGWRYLDESVWVFQTRSVGNYFSKCTGFPSTSLTASLGIFFFDFPKTEPPDIDTDGFPVPNENQCHVRYGLETISDQSAIRSGEMTAEERRRKDIWWVEPDGSNAETVCADISRSVIEYGLPLLLKPYNTRSVQLERRGFRDNSTGC